MDESHLLDKGVNIFQEGVKIEKGIEDVYKRQHGTLWTTANEK